MKVSTQQILVVDDDPAIRSSLHLLLTHRGYGVTLAANAAEAMEAVRAAEPALVLMDMNYTRSTSGAEGLTLLRQVKLFRPDVPVILMTAWGSIELAVEGMKLGAADFLAKPWRNQELLQRIEALTTPPPAAAGEFDRSLLVGDSDAMCRVIDTLRRVAPTDASVLIMGENGTGKELVAETIHRNSLRREGPLVKVNLGGVAQSLFESEMFGHRRGAFTGAVADRKGRFELAHRGTIFLDEIGELDLACQVKLLRVLQEHTFEPLGQSTPLSVDCRVVSATNAPLPLMVADGTFREDLFYRLNLITITLPPLRERPDDIAPLAAHFAAGRASFAPDALDALRRLPLPGNVRELRNVVERAILTGGDRITAATVRECVEQSPVRPSDTTLDAQERALLQQTLTECGGNISRAAARLGLSRQALYRRIDKHHIPLS